jgi:hypothetical protein
MAKEVFDFNAFKELKLVDYKKQHAKTQIVKKAKAALVLIKYDLGSKKKQSLIIPFKKMDEAVLAYKELKSNKKIHLVKFTSLVKVIQGQKEVTLEIKKGGLAADVIQTELQELFDKVVMLGLNVTGTSDDADAEGAADAEDSAEVVSEASTDTDSEESSLKELNQSFQEAKQMYKQVGKVEANLKAKTMLATWNKIEDLMPQLQQFIASSDKKGQVETAEKINTAAKTIQNALKPSIDKIKAKQGEKSNTSLDSLTGGISGKAAQLLKDYQDEIASIDGLADKLKSISQIS